MTQTDFENAPATDSADLPMPSDVRKAVLAGPGKVAGGEASRLAEPPSAKLMVRLFLIPLLIVGAGVGVMWVISLMAGGAPTFEQALTDLKQPGGGRTVGLFLGPAAKQRLMAAEVIAKKIRTGMTEAERVKLADELITILRNHTQADEGQVRHFLLIALGRSWQRDPAQPAMDSAEAVASRNRTVEALASYADDPDVNTRKAAMLGMVYLAGWDEARLTLPTLVRKLTDHNEDVDVRIAAATALGPLAKPTDEPVIDALHAAMNEDDPRKQELQWSSALSLAQLGQEDVADTILKLLDRGELATLQYYDRETDPKNPSFRPLNDRETERILVNTMMGAGKLKAPAVREKLRWLTANDPSARVRATGRHLGLVK